MSSKGRRLLEAGGWERFGDSRDRLRRACPFCGGRLLEATLAPAGIAGPTAHGTYACGGRFMAWATGLEGTVCVRSCEGREAVVEEGLDFLAQAEEEPEDR